MSFEVRLRTMFKTNRIVFNRLNPIDDIAPLVASTRGVRAFWYILTGNDSENRSILAGFVARTADRPDSNSAVSLPA